MKTNYTIKLWVSVIIGLCLSNYSNAQAGCIDPLAFNYDSTATVSCEGAQVCCLYNDMCAEAQELTVDGPVVFGDNSGATDENDALDDVLAACWLSDGLDGDVWFSFEGTGTPVDIETTAGTNTDTQIAVYKGCDGEIVGCDDDSGVSLLSLVSSLCTEQGQIYYIEVEGYNGT